MLRALDYSRYWAAKQGKRRPPSSSYVMAGGDAPSLDALLAGMKRGLVVTRFWYCNLLDPLVATVTGLTRDGVFLVEDGKVVAPVNNFRFNVSMLELLKNVDAATKETWRVESWLRVPAVRVNEFTMASVSDAV